MSDTFIEKSWGENYFLFWFFYWVCAQIEVISTVLMTRVSSFILFRKQEIDCAYAIAVIILSSLNQPYWIPQAAAVPEAGAARKIDFLDRKRGIVGGTGQERAKGAE